MARCAVVVTLGLAGCWVGGPAESTTPPPAVRVAPAAHSRVARHRDPPPGAYPPVTCSAVVAPAAAAPVVARIVAIAVSGGVVIATVAAGCTSGVDASWTGQLIDSAQQPVAGGTFTITRVGPHVTVGTLQLSTNQITASLFVQLSP